MTKSNLLMVENPVDNRRVSIRKKDLLKCLSKCDDDKSKVEILVKMVLKQEDEIAELRENYIKLLHAHTDEIIIVER